MFEIKLYGEIFLGDEVLKLDGAISDNLTDDINILDIFKHIAL
jgi:hypothetical protein